MKTEVEGLRKEKDEMYAALTQKHQESLNYYAEIERLNGVLEEHKVTQQVSDLGWVDVDLGCFNNIILLIWVVLTFC